MTVAERERELIILSQAGDGYAFNELYLQVERLLHGYAHKYANMGWHSREEIFSMVCEYFVIAVYNFNVELGYRFSTYLAKIVWSRYTKEISAMNRLKRKAVVLSLDAQIVSDSDKDSVPYIDRVGAYEADFSTVELDNILTAFNKVFNKLQPLHKEVVTDHIIHQMEHKDIIKKYGMSKQQVSAIIVRFRTKVSRELAI